MKPSHDDVAIDPLAVGLTRVALFMGISLRLFFTNLIVATLVCVDAHTLWGIPLFFLTYLILLKFSLKEPHFLEVWGKAIFKTPPVLNSWFWGKTNSYEAW